MRNGISNSRNRKPYEELTFADDFMFCKVMQSDPELCRELLEVILGRKVRRIISTENQKPIEITADSKGIRLDVYLDDNDQNVYDIEMQTTLKRELPKRMRYYQGMIDLNMIERGSKYETLRQSYIIFICLDNPFPESGRHKYSFSYACQEDPNVKFKNDAFGIILSARGRVKDVSEELMNFLQYLLDKKVTSVLTEKIDEKVDAARKHKKWRMDYMTFYGALEEARDEAREEGLKEGLILGTIETLRSQNHDDLYIAEVLQRQRGLSEEEAWSCLNRKVETEMEN